MADDYDPSREPRFDGDIGSTGWGRWVRIGIIVIGAGFAIVLIVAMATGWGPR